MRTSNDVHLRDRSGIMYPGYIPKGETHMIYALVRFTVEDQAKWRPVFEEVAALRKTFGSTNAHAFCKSESRNEITVLLTFSDRQKAEQMFQSQEFREATKRGGMVAPPEVTFLDEVANLPS
jgi:uncharacterized protein (DUF1330 family)